MSFKISLFSIVNEPNDVREYMGISYIMDCQQFSRQLF